MAWRSRVRNNSLVDFHTGSDVIKGAGVASLLAFAAPAQAAQRTQSGLIYEVQKSNPKGKQPVKGDLIAIRFKGATTDGNVFDDTTKTDEPLYYRVGTGSLIAGIEEILPMMRYKEKWACLLYTSPSPRDKRQSRMPSSA